MNYFIQCRSQSNSTLLHYACLVLFLGGLLITPGHGQVSVLTAQNDNARTSANLNEAVLNTSNVNVNQFGKLFSRSLDGYLYAQPLYMANVAIPGNGIHNVVYLATLHNTVLAFDADDPSQAAPFWQVNLGPSRTPCCVNNFMTPEMGIVSTPVIDPNTSTLYVVVATLENGSDFYRLHALDITTGQEKSGGPVTIQASVPGNGPDSQAGVVAFNTQYQLQRAGLLLANGTVYVAFASIDDGGYWHGWMIGYKASNIQQQVGVNNSTPNGNGGGIWQSGRGLVADANGYVYLLTGNGDYDGVSNLGDSLVRLSSTGAVMDWFTPDDQATLAAKDEDLGSSGPLLIPGTNLLVGGGKQGVLYLVNSSNMGHFQTGNGQIVQNFQATSGEIHHVAYWNRSGAPLLYVWGSADVLRAFQFGNGTFNSTPITASSMSSSFPGGALAVSANGSTPGSGIVWATTPSGDSTAVVVPGTLRAFDASNVSTELWDSDQNGARDSLGDFGKFATPTIANGKVYVPTFSNELTVYGLLGNSSGVSIWLGPRAVDLTASGQQQFSATVAGSSNTGVTWSMSPSVGTLTANGLYTAPGNIPSSQTVTITATSMADPTKSASATVTLTPTAVTGTATFVTLDTTTQGGWKGVYGSNGYNVINDSASYPPYVTVTQSGTNSHSWAGSTTDVRALLKATSSTDRIAATWYTSSSFSIDMVFNDGLQHQLAIYCLDWDSTIRTQTVTIQDANGVVLNTQNISNFHNGEYLVWQVTGHVRVNVSNTNTSANAVIAGLFFDITGSASSFTLTGPAGGALNTASSNFTVTPNGTYNGTITVTPSGGGLSTPIALTYNSSAASQTFSITPTVVGPVTLTPSNNGSLTNPAALTYATPPSAPVIGTATAGDGQATVSFTAPTSTGGSPITSYTATCGSQSVSGAVSPITVTGLTNGTSYTCTVTATNGAGISAPSAASNSVTPAGVASSFTLTGPAGGALNTASTNFTVTPNGTYNGTITITPSGGGLSTPITLAFNSSATSQTFSITPTAVGPVTLTPSNNGSLTNPAALTYATPPSAPVIGTATAGNRQATISFTAPTSTGGAPITSHTATCGSQSVSGAASPITVTGLTNGTSYTCTVTATNAEGMSAPSAVSNSVTPNVVATSFTFTGPAGGALSTASANFTVTPNGTYNGTITVTPSGGGLSTPITLTFNGSAAPQTFTITPTAVGPVMLTPSNSGSLTNPAELTYATPPSAPTMGTATAGNGQATVSFTAPASNGGSPVTSYTATCGSQSASGTASPITVTGLTNGTSYTCTVTATNAEGMSAPSTASNSVTPSLFCGIIGCLP